MLKKLLPLITECVVILNHIGVKNLWHLQKKTNCVTPKPPNLQNQIIDLFLKKSANTWQNFNPPLPSLFYVNIINVWFLTCLLWYEFFSVLEKITILLLKRNKPNFIILLVIAYCLIYCLLPILWIVSQVASIMNGILWNFICQKSIDVDSRTQ